MDGVTYAARGLLGRTEAGDRVHVEIELRVREGERTTVEHEPITDPLELGIMGAVTEKGEHNCGSSGQVTEAASEVTTPAPGLTVDEVQELASLWREWHLNALQAGCAHQTVVWEQHERYGYRQPSLTLTQPCPDSGYRYGTAWLVRPLPDEVAARVRVIGDKLDGSQARG